MSRINLPVLFNQEDPTWAQKLLGNNTNNPYTIGNFGCTLSDLAMICKYYGIDVNPATLNDKLVASGGFLKGSGEYV